MTFRHRAGVRLYTSSFDFAQPCVFVKQLPGPILCASPCDEDPLLRTYGVNLPSSLTMNLPSALVYSTRLRVSVYGTGALTICLEHFLGSRITHTIGSLRGENHTIKFGSDCGFTCNHQLLHSSTRTSVASRWCHFFVCPSLIKAVTEY